MLSISEASEFLGAAISTLRRWESEKKITSQRTEGGHRRYDKNRLISLKNWQDNIKLTIGYCRVSSSNQKGDLERQKSYYPVLILQIISKSCIQQ